MSSLHFASTEQYRNRIIQLGEDPAHVFNVGAPGIENIERLEFLDRSALQRVVGLDLEKPTILVTFHPETLKTNSAGRDFETLLSALDETENLQMVITKSNADTEGRTINGLIDEFVKTRPHAVAQVSLGQKVYLSLLKYVVGVVGNSSSGIIEAPSLKTGTVNIGDRQKGRVRASSILDCEPEVNAIKNAVSRLTDQDFQDAIRNTDNPHGGGKVSRRIMKILTEIPLDHLHQKRFYDLPMPFGPERRDP
jgi:GDP/UDP-N,N'-diacetylbacillosamine 2-epimerase (hydrolysing)